MKTRTIITALLAVIFPIPFHAAAQDVVIVRPALPSASAVPYSVSTTPECFSLCAEVERTSYRDGEPVIASISWNGVAQGSVLRVDILRSGPAGRQRSTLIGPLSIQNGGTLTFEWSGEGLPCPARAGNAHACGDRDLRGQYVIQAEILDGSTTLRSLLLPRTDPAQEPAILDQTSSRTFTVR